ncbi:MAG TPA: hypothetical protein VFN42_08645, partial [Acetobacteraceae bacterium]|nr:hypothetical protein [Acetobacteraceae bacterium]
GPATFTLTWTSERFAKANPKNLPIFVAALRQADKFIEAHPEDAAKLYAASTHTKIPLPDLVKMITDKQVHWTTQPQQTMKYARFMAKIGMIPAAPSSWKEMFFPEITDRPGS